MKHLLSILIVAVIACVFAPKAAAQDEQKYQSTAVAMMQYDKNGKEMGWTPWNPCNTVITTTQQSIVFNADNLLFNEDVKFNIVTASELQKTENGHGRVEYAVTGDNGEEAIISMDYDPKVKDEFILSLETNDGTVGFKIKDSSLQGTQQPAAKKPAKRTHHRH